MEQQEQLVPLLKYLGARVVAVANTRNISLVKELGADRVMNYEREDFTKDKQQFHFVLDAVGKSTFGKCKDLLLPGGIYISSELGPGAQNIFYALWSSILGTKKSKKVIFPIPVKQKESVLFVKNMLLNEAYTPVVDTVFSLEEVQEAFAYVLTGEKTGNVVIKITNS